MALSLQLTLRGAELHIQCDWHLIGVLILRGRYLSTRNPGSASPVEADHPRMDLYYTTFTLTKYKIGHREEKRATCTEP